MPEGFEPPEVAYLPLSCRKHHITGADFRILRMVCPCGYIIAKRGADFEEKKLRIKKQRQPLGSSSVLLIRKQFSIPLFVRTEEAHNQVEDFFQPFLPAAKRIRLCTTSAVLPADRTGKTA